jgi:peptidoglycan/xylan/chitin deacetylase (PgdA/CDA1 family)
MLPPALPAPPRVAVSAETRLAYVLHHFGLAYPGAPMVSVGYAGIQPQVEVAEHGEAFFVANVPSLPAPAWREWMGQQVPFFFDEAPEKPLLILQETKAIISADIISAAFYLLSGWQEYFSSERDQHGRFPYTASVQKKYGFVALPVVNYYFDVLKTAVEHVSGQPLQPRRWGSQAAEFAAFISHDVDNMRSGWKAPAKAALQQRKVGLFSRLLRQQLAQTDTWDNLEEVAAATAQYGMKSTFFILPSNKPATNGTPNADYPLTNTLLKRLYKLQQQGCEIGLHGSIGTAINSDMLADESYLIGSNGGVRFHYLYWEPRQTLEVLITAGLTTSSFLYDSTLGFAEHFGFRNSYCLPFYPFDFKKRNGEAVEFLEIPLNVMDATLHHPNYLQLGPAEILPALQPMFAEIKRFGGVASVLWHNQNFDPANTQNGPQQFHEIMAHLQQQGAAFLTGCEVWQEFTAERSATNSYIHNS